MNYRVEKLLKFFKFSILFILVVFAIIGFMDIKSGKSEIFNEMKVSMMGYLIPNDLKEYVVTLENTVLVNKDQVESLKKDLERLKNLNESKEHELKMVKASNESLKSDLATVTQMNLAIHTKLTKVSNEKIETEDQLHKMETWKGFFSYKTQRAKDSIVGVFKKSS